MPAMALLTSEQYLALPAELDQNGDPVKHELIGGEIVYVHRPSEAHNFIKTIIIRALLQYEFTHHQITVKVLTEMAFVVTGQDTLVPDVSLMLKSRMNPRKHKYIMGAPELAIDVVSSTDKATYVKSKVDAYLGAGSNGVWAVYPDARSVMVHTPGSVLELKADQKIEHLPLPGLSIPVSAVFELA